VAAIGYNDLVNTVSRRRLRSASVQLGALTALALTLTACNQVDDDDDCDSRSGQDSRSLAIATPTPSATATPTQGVQARFNQTDPKPSAVPSQGGFGTYQASCGG